MPELQHGLQELRERMTAAQLNPDELIGSLTGGVGMAVILNEAAMVNLPLGARGTLTFPTPYLVLMAKVEGDSIYRELDKMLTAKGLPVTREDNGEVHLRSVQVPLPTPFAVVPTVVSAPGLLLIASHPDAAKWILATRDGQHPALVATDDFKQLAQGLPTDGNQWHYLSPRVAPLLRTVQQAAMQSNPLPQESRAALQKLLGDFQSDAYSYGVVQVTDEGLVFIANSSMNIGQVALLQAAVLPVAIVAGAALPALTKARSRAREVNSAGNMKQLGLALLMYSGDHDGEFPAADGVDGLRVLVKDNYLQAGKVFIHPESAIHQEPTSAETLTEDTCSYLYVGGGLKDDNAQATSMPLIVEKPGITDDGISVLYVDGHVERVAGRFTSMSELAAKLLAKGGLNDANQAWVAAKAQALDARRQQYGY
jgi:prepilin-type processing-associated H-X9-DG protein